MEGLIQELLQWVTAHPGWSYAIVFAIAFTESIFMLGLLVPGVILLFGVGAIIPTGAIRLMPVLGLATAGAIIGDCLSYWLGRGLQRHLYELWPLRKYPGLVARGEQYFQKHGGKSVLFGRFVGAVRPIIPAVAGVAGMRPLQFVIVDSLSAIIWAPCYILPGTIVGASLGLAAEVASRLMVILLSVGLVVFVAILLTRRVLRLIPVYAESLLDWSHRHRVLGRVGASLADPAQPEAPALALAAVALLVLSWVVFGFMWGFLPPHYPMRSDALTFQLFQDLRTPTADLIAVAIAQLGDWEVYVPITIAVLLGLMMVGRDRAAAHWLAAALFSATLAFALSGMLSIPEPAAYFSKGAATHFEAGHIVFATVMYGFLPVLLSSRLEPARRLWYYGPFVGVIVLIAFARLYLGAQWLSETLLGLFIGAVWVGLLALGYRRHRPQLVPDLPLLGITLLVVVLAGSLQWTTQLGSDLARYQRARVVRTLSTADWVSSGFASQPAYLIDTRGRPAHPLNLQWAGELPDIEARLLELGWNRPRPLTLSSSILWLTSAPEISKLPVLPQVHDGRHQALLLTHPIDKQHQWVIRLWPSTLRIETDRGAALPVWTGNITRQNLKESLDVASVPFTDQDFDAPLTTLRDLAYPGRGLFKPVVHPAHSATGETWNGTVLLLKTDPAGIGNSG